MAPHHTDPVIKCTSFTSQVSLLILKISPTLMDAKGLTPELLPTLDYVGAVANTHAKISYGADQCHTKLMLISKTEDIIPV
jgi:hypothetical protein